MNESSKEIVAQIIDNLPRIGCTLSQEEADAIKQYIRTVYFNEDIQSAVHSGFIRQVKTPEEIKDLLWDEVPETDEHNDPVSNHNTLVLAGFIRGKEVGSGRGYEVER